MQLIQIPDVAKAKRAAAGRNLHHWCAYAQLLSYSQSRKACPDDEETISSRLSIGSTGSCFGTTSTTFCRPQSLVQNASCCVSRDIIDASIVSGVDEEETPFEQEEPLSWTSPRYTRMLGLPATATGCSYTMRITARTEDTPVSSSQQSLKKQSSFSTRWPSLDRLCFCVTVPTRSSNAVHGPWVSLLGLRAVRSRYAPCFQQASSPMRLVTEGVAAERYHRRVLRRPRKCNSLSVETQRLCGRGVQTNALRKVIPHQRRYSSHSCAGYGNVYITTSQVSLLGRGHLVPSVTPEQRSRRIYV